MEYRILGPLELVDDGRPVALSARKQRALLLRLLLRANEVVSADALIDALWGEQPPSSAAKLVQVYVSQLRRTLGDSGDRDAPAGLRDARRARAARRRALRAAARRRPRARWRRRTRRSRRAPAARRSALWRGGRSRTPTTRTFAAAEVGRLEELRLAALEERLDADLALGRHGEVVAELEALVAEHPLRERLRAQLMLALYRCGRQADALEAYRRRAPRAASTSSGSSPARELRDLEHAILDHDPALERAAPPSRAPPSALPVPTHAALGRRDASCAELDGAAARDDVRLVTLTGPGGIGKTRLALELARAAGAAVRRRRALRRRSPPLRDPDARARHDRAGARRARDARRAAREALARWLADRELLLVVDNFEHAARRGARARAAARALRRG